MAIVVVISDSQSHAIPGAREAAFSDLMMGTGSLVAWRRVPIEPIRNEVGICGTLTQRPGAIPRSSCSLGMSQHLKITGQRCGNVPGAQTRSPSKKVGFPLGFNRLFRASFHLTAPRFWIVIQTTSINDFSLSPDRRILFVHDRAAFNPVA